MSYSSSNPEKKYLDQAGLVYTWGKARQKFASLVNGKVPSNQLPSFVDDVVEFEALPTGYAAFDNTKNYAVGAYVIHDSKLYKFLQAYTAGGTVDWTSTTQVQLCGESGKIYVDLSNNKTYRWSGSTFVDLSDPNGAVKGNSSGTTQGHVVTWGTDGYHLSDSGKSVDDLKSDVEGKIIVGDSAAITQDSSSDVTDPTLAFYQNGDVQSAHGLVGGTNIGVMFDASEGDIVFSHGTPTGGSAISPSSDGSTNIGNLAGSTQGQEVITEVTIDSTGHVTAAKKKTVYVTALSTTEIDDAIAAAEAAVSIS